MSSCSFLAPNGEKSILYAALEQKYGPDKATQLWNWAKTEQFDNSTRDANGEPTIDAVESAAGGQVNPASFMNHSGGADGADAAWDQIGRKYGFTKHTHYREPGQKTVDSSALRAQGITAQPLDDQTYAEGKAIADQIDQIIGENPNRGYGHYRYRNYGQVKNADAVFAISTGFGQRAKMKTEAHMPLDRGTIYAIVGAILKNKPVYVFDQRGNVWYTYDKTTKKFVLNGGTPTLTRNYAGVGTRNITDAGKAAIEAVFKKTLESKSPLPAGQSATEQEADPNRIEVARDQFDTRNSLEAFTNSIKRIYEQARANPGKTYVIPFTPSDVLWINEQKITGPQLVNILDMADTPVNVEFQKSTLAQMQNLPKRFMKSVAFETPNPMLLDEASVKRQMDLVAVQVRDSEHNPTGEYFTLEKQEAAIDAIIYKFYNALTKVPAGQGANIREVRDQIYNDFNNMRIAATRVANGEPHRFTFTREQAAAMAADYTAVVNAFHVGKQPNGLWNFAMKKLDAYGIRVRKDGKFSDADSQPDTAVIKDADDGSRLEEIEGGGLRDFSDSSFELDAKDTASTRMKLFLLSTVDSYLNDEEQPPMIKMSFNNEQTRKDILHGLKKDTIRTAEQAAALGIITPDKLPKGLSQPEKDAMLQKVFEVEGLIPGTKKLIRVTAKFAVNEAFLAQPDFPGLPETLGQRLTKEEGVEPKPGDIYMRLEPYVQKKDILMGKRNFLGMAQLADYETLFQDLAGLLANREPSYKNYLAAMQNSPNANIRRVAQKLTESAPHIQKEFVAVMSAHYQRMLMVLFTKGFDGHIESRIIDSNRNSELQTIQRFWQENQKDAPILITDEHGQTVINKELAKELHTELLAIYNTKLTPSYDINDFNELDKKYGYKRSHELREERRVKIFQEKKALDARKRALFDRLMEVNGIILDDRAKADLFDSNKIIQFTTGKTLHSLFVGWTLEGKPMGIVDVLITRLLWGSDTKKDEVHEAYKANNPLYTENTAMSILAQAQLQYTPNVYSNTHKDAAGKTIFSYGLNTSLSHAVRKLKESAEYRDRYKDSFYASRSWLLKELDSISLRDRFQLTYMDGLKNQYGSRDGVTRSDMSDREQLLMAMSLFQNKGRPSVANYVSLTHSDKTKTPVYMNAPKISNLMEMVNGQLWVHRDMVQAVFRHVFMAEYDRMVQPGGESIKGYAQGKKYYYHLPKLNQSEVERMVKAKVIGQGDYDALWKADGTPQSVEHPLFEQTAKKLIRMQLNEMLDKTISDMNASGLLEVGKPGGIGYYNFIMRKAGFNGQDSSWYIANGQKLSEEDVTKNQIKLAAADFTFNSFLFNTSLSQLFYGDPALTFKKSLHETFVEYGKRLAKDVAPGRDGEFSHSPSYVTITALDYQPIARELAGIPGYNKGVEATDAQEVTTVQEHLDVMFAYGKITQTQWEEASKIIREANGGYYDFKSIPGLHEIIMQPMKPVATGLRKAEEGVMSYDYVKSSSFPLYPPMTNGLQLDKLRRAMETTGVQRLNYSSAKKIGAPVRMVQLFNEDGTIDNEVFKGYDWLRNSRQTLDRSEFRLQQEVPYDEEKEAILTVSQMNKLIVEKVPTIKSTFRLQGQDLTGTQLRAEKESIRKKLVQLSHSKFLKKVGAEMDETGEKLIFKDKKKFYKLLAEEAAGRDGYTMNDVMALTSFMENSDELVVPLTFSPSASRFEGLMMSMIKQIIKIKMPGHSFIQASPAGFKTMQTWEESKLDLNSIVWTKPFDGELKTAHKDKDGNVQPAQVLVGFNYFTDRGERINIQDYIIEQDGKKMLDTARLPRELFQMIGARIPNQGHSSMLPIEIVGFLPQTMGDMIVVPAAITKQMGADFDVDKLYTYHRAYKEDGNRLIPVGSKYSDPTAAENDEQLPATLDYDPAFSDIISDPEQEEAYLKNRYFDIHWSVLTNADMFQHMMSPLDKADAKEEAELLSPPGRLPYYWSPSYQLNDFQSMKGAKVLVGQTSLALTHNAVMQDKNVQLVRTAMVDNGTGEKVPQDVPDPIIMHDDEGNEIALTHLSGYGESYYTDKEGKKEKRTKADNIQIQQNESVDHAKNRIIDKLNLDPNTSGASLGMSRLQTEDKGTPGQDDFVPGQALNFTYNTRLLMQPIVREYAAALSKANDTLSTNFDANVKDKVFGQLMGKYFGLLFEASGKDAAVATQVREELKKSFKYNPETMLESLRMTPKKNGPEYFARQILLLTKFREFDSLGKQLVTIQSVTSQDTRGAGKGMLGVLGAIEKTNKLGSAIGDEVRRIAGAEELHHKDGAPTEVGEIYSATIDTAYDLFGEDLPYAHLQETYEQIAVQSGRIELSDDAKKTVFNAMKSYIFSSNKLGLYPDAAVERMRLLFSRDGSKSLARRVQQAKKTWGKNNYFLQRLQPNIDPDGINPDMIEYNAAKASRADDFENSSAWLEMMRSDDPQQKTLGEDLLRYVYATGGLQGPRNFVKFIPWAAIEGSSISVGIRDYYHSLEEMNNLSDLRQQIIQHNPHMAKQLKPGLKELGGLESIPDSFELPAIDADTLRNNPAKDLVLNIKVEGKITQEYPQLISYREGKQWKLFRYTGKVTETGTYLYTRIDILGNDKGLMEYSSTGTGEAWSVIAENRSPWFETVEAQPYMLSINSMDHLKSEPVQSNVLRQIGLHKTKGDYSDILNALNVIKVDRQQPEYLRVIAATLAEMKRNQAEVNTISKLAPSRDFTYEIKDLGDRVGGQYQPLRNNLRISPRFKPTKKAAAETLVHELLHYHTSMLAMSMETEAQWEARDLPENFKAQLRKSRLAIELNPSLAAKMNDLEDLRKEIFEKFKKAVLDTKGEEAWREAQQNKGEFGTLHYGLSTTVEFISHVFTNKEVMDFLNKIPRKAERKSVIERLSDLISQIWGAMVKAFGANKGSYLEEAVKQTLDVLMHQQAAITKQQTSMAGDYSLFADSLTFNSIATAQIADYDKVIGKLDEQLNDLYASYTGVIAPELRHDKRRKIDSIKEDIQKLRDTPEEERDIAIITEIGAKHLKWVAAVNGKKDATANEIMTATRIGNMWRSIIDIMYGDAANSVDAELAKIAAQTTNIIHSLTGKMKDLLTEESNGFVRPTDYEPENLADTSYVSTRIRSLSSAASSRVIQHVAGFVETVGRHENEDTYRLNRELTALENEMAAYAGGKKNLKSIYNKLMRQGDNAWGLTMQYSQKWFDWRRSSIAKRNGQLNRVDKDETDPIAANQKRKAIWEEFWKDVHSNAAFVDTRLFFDAKTGQFKDDIQKHKDDLAKKVGADHVETMLARAQERYLRYVEDRTTYFDLLEQEKIAGEKTEEEVAAERIKYQNTHSPNVFFDHLNKNRSFQSASDRYVTMAPLSSREDLWNEGYQEIMNDEKLRDFYRRYSALIDKLMTYLPKSVQERVGSGFLPIVRASMLSDGLDVVAKFREFNENATRSVGANEYQEHINERTYSKLPLNFINDNEAAIEERSRDMIGIARVFGAMALHYKHFSAAKDMIDMGETILKEVDRARSEGAMQVKKNGRIVTINKGLDNSLAALQYLKDYMVFRKPKALEFSTGIKLYAENTAKGKKFTLNPVQQHRISKRVGELLKQRDEIEEKYKEQDISLDEYNEAIKSINDELTKYEGYTLYGSKIGDKLIGINQLKALSYNPFSAVANIGFGLLSVIVHAQGKGDFTGNEAWAAFRMMLASTRAKLGMKNEQAIKILNVMDRLGVIGDYVDTKYGEAPKVRDNKPTWRKYADPFAMLKSTDFFMKGTTTLAVLLNRKVKVTEDGVEKEISIWEALDNEGKWDAARFGENKEWYSEDVTEQKQWDKLRNRLVRVNMILHGNQDKNSPKLVNKNIMGRLLGQFRMSWLPEGWYTRFQKEHYDEYLERNVKGRYSTLVQVGISGSLMYMTRSLMNLIPGVKFDASSGVLINNRHRLADSAVDLENMRRNFAELSLYMALTTAILMLKYASDDDDEKDPALMIAINMGIRLNQDISFYASPGVFDAVTRNVIPATAVISDYIKFVKASARYVMDDEYEFEQWLLKMTKAGLPIPQATLVNKFRYMSTRSLDSLH